MVKEFGDNAKIIRDWINEHEGSFTMRQVCNEKKLGSNIVSTVLFHLRKKGFIEGKKGKEGVLEYTLIKPILKGGTSGGRKGHFVKQVSSFEIKKWIAARGIDKTFTSRIIADALNLQSISPVSNLLRNLYKHGLLDRTFIGGEYVYKKTKNWNTNGIDYGLYVDTVWEILKKAKRPLLIKEILSKAGIPHTTKSYNAVRVLLNKWHKRGYVRPRKCWMLTKKGKKTSRERPSAS